MDLIFPPKDLEKNTGAQTKFPRFFFCEKFICSVSIGCSKYSNFPAKRLTKNTGAQNTHAPIFFFLNFQRYILFNVLLLRKIK